MPPTRAEVRTLLLEYLESHPAERTGLASLFAALDSEPEHPGHAPLPGLITCSAVVINRDRCVLHLGDPASGRSLLPGGELGDGRTLQGAALRELSAQTGIHPGSLCLTPQVMNAPIDVRVHAMDGDPAGDVPACPHVDFRFVFCPASEQPPDIVVPDRGLGSAQWRPFADVSSPALRAKLLHVEAHGLDGRPEPLNASALIHDGYGRYLLHLRDLREGIWEPGVFSLLGGGRERDDSSLEATLRRELAEEVPGLRIADLKPYALEEATGTAGLSVPIQVFEGRWNGDPATANLQEGVLLAWFTPDVLDRLRLSPGLGDIIRSHAARDRRAERTSATVRSGRDEVAAGAGLHIVDVHLLAQDGRGRILLGLHNPDAAGTGNRWELLGGRCGKEEAISRVVREAEEEAGLIIEPDEVELVHVIHRAGPQVGQPRLGLVFRARSWSGTPMTPHPGRVAEWRFWNPKELPSELDTYTRAAIDGLVAGRLYTATSPGRALVHGGGPGEEGRLPRVPLLKRCEPPGLR
ncbi:NUDIX domain-containing protein [Streptomyces sp. NPDC086010]|uniref:NUDIX domain-containing protein n=1 Tax=Streptomyces sp. NPDC086010 TaxID=3365745 RepID=UPI0037D4E17F